MALAVYYNDFGIEAGCDEAGRGCLAGPVVAGAVILPKDFTNDMLNDSKQLSERKRDILFPIIMEASISYGIGVVSPEEIDRINILNASFLAMHRAIEQLQPQPELLLIDGNRFKPYGSVKHHCIIKGDGKYMSIAAASVLAKVHRDQLMADYDVLHPQYGWKKNKGYPTKMHREAIKIHGETDYHRKSFKLLADEQLSLDF